VTVRGSRLARLEIEDFGLIERASLEFSPGFTVCSGETGSGKTMLLGALAFVLGERTPADMVRAGASRTRVSLAVDADAAFCTLLEAEGFEPEPGEAAILSRELLASGKSTARINGRLATAAQLRTAGEALADAVGQHEQQRLLSAAYQLDVLDAFAGEAALGTRAAVGAAYGRAVALESDLAAHSGDAKRLRAEYEFAQFAAAEIAAAAPVPGEDEPLRERRDFLANVERIGQALAYAHAAVTGGDGSSAVESLGIAATALAGVARFSPTLAALAERLAALQSDATDVAVALGHESEAAEFDPRELEGVTARLDLLETLKKKYGGTLAAVCSAHDAFEATVAREATRDERESALRGELARVRSTLESEALALGALRAAAARELEARVAIELAALAMPAARFGVVLETLAEAGPSGGERVSFALSPNPGEPLRPVARAASGGELSRVLLALVAVLADRRERTALVFDEIDAGIGGATGSAVGVRLGALGRATQVLCVTHLAQIASFADRHYVLRKRERAGTTVVELVALEEPGAVLEEIARMLSGSASPIALEHARAVVDEARAAKTRANAPAKTDVAKASGAEASRGRRRAAVARGA
jgi:DNA repair protein RecN (Recombination protein N)